MTININTLTLIQVAEDIRFLAEHARCPQRQRDFLFDWTSLVLGQHAKSAFREKALLGVVDALVTLSHANAAFSRSMAPPFYRGEPKLDVDDQGGYFAGRRAVTMLIRSLPVNDELRLSLANHVLTRIDHDLRCLQSLVPFS